MIYNIHFFVCYTCVPQVAKTHDKVHQRAVVAAPIHCVVDQQDIGQVEVLWDCSNLNLSLIIHNVEAGYVARPDMHMFICIGGLHDVHGGWQLGLIK